MICWNSSNGKTTDLLSSSTGELQGHTLSDMKGVIRARKLAEIRYNMQLELQIIQDQIDCIDAEIFDLMGPVDLDYQTGIMDPVRPLAWRDHVL